MEFVCIQNCSVCPFFNRDISRNVLKTIEKVSVLPDVLANSVEKSAETISQENITLPALTENTLEYSISDLPEEKKTLFTWRKRK